MDITPYGYKPPDSFTPNEVAQMLKVKASTVYAWLSRHELRATRLGHRRYVRIQDLREFMQNRNYGEFTDYRYSPRTNADIC